MRKLPPLNALKVFEATARLGSAQKASEELHVTHGAISRHVKQLESWLGITLFDRSQRSLKLNTLGKSYIQTISAALDLIQEGTINIQNIKSSNTLGLATTHSFASKWLMEKLPDFYKRHSDIEVWLSLDQQLINLQQSNIDIGIRMGAGPWPDLHCIALMKDKLITVCSPLLLNQNNKLETPKDLAKQTLLHDQDPTTQWSRWFKDNQVLNIDPTKGPRFSSSDILLRAAMSGQGIALVSEKLAQEDIKQGRLIQLFEASVDLGDYHWLVIPKNKLEHINIIKFLCWIKSIKS
ncbi:transcriptional regulator GcvA [Pseudoalteromonas denitrificans]|uniref:LysR family transcriptional regulator, glycine cleavage system transcriptional activator n=1 Tax=Pseudoalteromonas denitrificans DSM 6059 TaxID=1123010 RepID=A0A1I1KM58_9GAMM|nr:transcriptional regulator GcvA [Pseudoalteromonas denitrificans]SFC61869.1 LysR family transcriptional regulator, glycine cleavage system transcriptional activator [Pseudoalteromonas denitrificans DSM 6059]